MRPIAELDRRGVRAVFTDIDDTLTSDGRLEAPAFDGLWRLHAAGVEVVPVTGRPAGWCDHLARMWPVAGVVGENGALYYAYDPETRRMRRETVVPEVERRSYRARLDRLAGEILADVPGAAIAADQPFRLFDLAIDFAEDVPHLPEAQIDRIVAHFVQAGAHAKVSSIHVNGWFGEYDKLSMIGRFAREVLDLDLGAAVYVGDSPNDEPAFRAFPRSVGVANVVDFAHRLRDPPKFVTPSRGGRGFAELVDHLLG